MPIAIRRLLVPSTLAWLDTLQRPAFRRLGLALLAAFAGKWPEHNRVPSQSDTTGAHAANSTADQGSYGSKNLIAVLVTCIRFSEKPLNHTIGNKGCDHP